MDQDVNQPRISAAFQNDFRELQAFASNPSAPVSPNNIFRKLYGTAGAAVTAVGASNLQEGRVGTVVNTVDVTGNSYPNPMFVKPGVPGTDFRKFPHLH